MRRLVVVTAVFGLALGGCGGDADDPAAADGDAATTDAPAGGGEDAAQLGVLEPGVDVADEPEDLSSAVFRAGEDDEPLVVRDVVRTDDSGFAEIRWFEGALARVDADTTYALTVLDTTPRAAAVETELEVGRIWNRLRADEVERYEVVTDVGTAAVRGTAFWVDCDASGCTFAVLEGEVVVTTADDEEVVLGAGQQATIGGAGVGAGPVGPTDATDPWVLTNAELDESAGFDPLPETGPAVLADDCPFVALPDGWTATEPEDPAVEWCRLEGPGPEGFPSTVEWSSSSPVSPTDEGRVNFEEKVAELRAACGGEPFAEFVEFDETLPGGQFDGFYWIAGPADPADDCGDPKSSRSVAVIARGQGFSMTLLDEPCTAQGTSGAEGLRILQTCERDVFPDRVERHRTVARTLLGG